MKLSELDKGIQSESFWCSDGAFRNSWMDLYPYLLVDFGKTKTFIVGLAIKGPPITHKMYGFPSFQVYNYVGHNVYDAIRETHADNTKIRTFTGLTAADIEKGQVKEYEFPYRVEVNKLKIYFKLRLGQKRVCLRIQFYKTCVGELHDDTDKCMNNKAGCEYKCKQKNTTFQCMCGAGQKLWRNGFGCIPTGQPVMFHLNNDNKKVYEIALKTCLLRNAELGVILTLEELEELIRIASKRKSVDHFIGVVDVDHDQSFSRWVDGSDVIIDNFNEKHGYPGSIGMLTKSGWTVKKYLGPSHYVCRERDYDSFLLTGFHGVQDYQLSSSPYLMRMSMASTIAFGTARSRRGSKAYLTSDSGEAYGLFWRPNSPTMPNKYLKLTTKLINVVTGVIVIGYKCTNPKLKFKVTNDTSSYKTRKYRFTVRAHSGNLQKINPTFSGKTITVEFDDTADCEGYQWDITGIFQDTFSKQCPSNICDQQCIKTPESYFCMCQAKYHLFIDGKTCLKDDEHNLKSAVALALNYSVFQNVIQSLSHIPVYYEFFPEKMDFTEAAATCREYGGYLPSIHTIFEHRLMYSHLSSHATCNKWLLGLKGKSLMHSAWLDGSWVDFALFEGTVPEHTNEEQVVFMDKDLFYMWNYGPVSTTQGCVVCQYRQNDCDLPILSGPWDINRYDWLRNGGSVMETNKKNNLILDLTSGLNFFESNEPQGYIQVDLRQTFYLHLLKCSSKTGAKITVIDFTTQIIDVDYKFMIRCSEGVHDKFNSITNEQQIESTFTCGSSAYDIKSTVISPPVKARNVMIKWFYEATEIDFTLKMELFGCPSFTNTVEGQTPQCGSKIPCLYKLKKHKSYECFHVRCPLRFTTCGPYTHYYKKFDRRKRSCESFDLCVKSPCGFGTVCLDYGNHRECHCPESHRKCDFQSGLYILLEPREVNLHLNIRFYFVVYSEVSNYTYTSEIRNMSCAVSFNKVYDSLTNTSLLCSTFLYRTTREGTFQARLKESGRGHLSYSSTVNYTVTFPTGNPVINHCLDEMNIKGASQNSFDKFSYGIMDDIHFKLMINDKECNAFVVTKWTWKLSVFITDTYKFCINEDRFVEKYSVPTDKGVLEVKGNTLSDGYFRICLHVGVVIKNESYSDMPVTCGYFRITPFPVDLIIKPEGQRQVVRVFQPLLLDASESKDPNTGDTSGFSYEWFCVPVLSTRNYCEFGQYIQVINDMLPIKGSILKIPKNTIAPEQKYNFTVRVSKPRLLSVTASVIVFITNVTKPDAKIRCVSNCNDEKILPSKLMALETDCDMCEEYAIKISAYKWHLNVWSVSDDKPKETLHIPTGNKKKTMVLLPGTLIATSMYTFEVKVYYNNNTAWIKIMYSFTTNDSPENGSCSITPTSGQALITNFIVSCPGYKDIDAPLTYRIFQDKKGKSDTLLCYGNKDTISFVLPGGPPDSSLWLILTVYIVDSLDTSSIFSLSVQVNNTQIAGINYIKWLRDAAIKTINEKPSRNDLVPKLLSIIKMLGSVKTTEIITTVENELKIKIREQCMKALETVHIEDKEKLFQTSYLVEILISQEDDISPNMKINTEIKLLVDVTSYISDTILRTVHPMEGPVNIHTQQMSLTVQVTKPTVDEFNIAASSEDLDNPSGSVSFPNDMKNTTDKPFDLEILILKINPFRWSQTSEKVNLPVMVFSMRNDGKTINPSNLSLPANIFISVNLSNVMEEEKINSINISVDSISHKVKKSSILHIVIPAIKGKTQILKMITINSSLTLQAVLGASESDVSLKNLDLHGFDWPIEEGALLKYKNHNTDPLLLYLPEDILGTNQTDFYVVIRVKLGQILRDEFDKSLKLLEINIGIQTFTVECSYWNDEYEDWRQDGCMVSPFTSLTTLHCWCSHLSVFSGGVFITPNTINSFGDARLFLTFFDNPVVVTLVVAVWIIYILLLIWARRADQKDLKKTGITILANISRTDNYVYMICVVTGWWAQAGTSSRVFIYLCGKDGRSARYALFDSSKKLFISGAENWFLIKTSHSLGKIKSVVVWHDSSGEQPSWYLKEIVVKDVQTDEVWHCLYNEWLSVDKGLATLQADIPAVEDAIFVKKRFYQFMQTSSRNFRDGHIWVSIFSKRPSSNFTRIQRLTCALCILLSTMLTNIMFHGIPRGDAEDQIDYGDFHLSLVDFVIGIESALIVFPVNMIVILLFRLTKPKPDTVLMSEEPVDDKMKLDEKKKSIFSKLRLPWYFLYVAYFVAFTTALICSYFVMLYGLKYGYNKSVAWLVSFFTSFFQSAFITEPVKVFAVAFLLTLIFRHSVQYDSGKQQEIGEPEEVKQDDYGILASHYIIPVSERLLKNIRTRIVIDQRTWEILMEIGMYFSFVAIVFLVVLGHSDVEESYNVTSGIENIYIRTLEYEKTRYFYTVTNSHTMWEYINYRLLQNVMFESSNTESYLVGRVRLRQIRVHKGLCGHMDWMPKLMSSEECFPPYSFGAEETRSFTKNWENETTDEEITRWTYQSAIKLGTLPIMGRLDIYPGGGYILQLPRNPIKAQNLLEYVKQTKWIDEQTRVVFVEFTLFNPNVQLFTVVVLMFEYSNTGFVFPYHVIYTANFYHYRKEFETFVAIVEFLFVLYLFMFTYTEFKKCLRMKWQDYFSETWTFYELTILCLAYTTIALFINRILVCNRLMEVFSDSVFEKFVNFHTAAFYDSLLRYVMATLILLVILKFFKLLRFNIRLSMLSQTLYSARGKLIAYCFGLFGLTMAFAIFAVLVFGTTLEGYRNFPRTIASMFLFMMGKSDYYGLYEGNPVLGPLFFFFFSLTFQILMMQYFITLLMDAFHTTRMNMATVKTEVHMVQYILRKFCLIAMVDAQKRQAKRRIVEGF
ncbi:polycystic kidney disease protein 1-like 2 isoform X2 [Gigantopelta aegis]|uniref:polycystic kidney disease protein 1-like 2 isoform X2 n=1 Tax=Gigantopelta aegis TaxID=1735272 RepID=UPI001B889CA8|nr:polycystic kidney disease protein 1-like 2 isoform X2 [Gigantopelta aegis]